MDNSDWDQFIIIDDKPTVNKKDISHKEIISNNLPNDAIKRRFNSYIELLCANSPIFRKIIFSLCYFTISIYNK
tara:strand:+ start:253 stop:474 length:222 start_codon:yes stop_codon:yes gene_type:complete